MDKSLKVDYFIAEYSLSSQPRLWPYTSIFDRPVVEESCGWRAALRNQVQRIQNILRLSKHILGIEIGRPSNASIPQLHKLRIPSIVGERRVK